ncbi:MAG: hypothetical protein EHM68_16750 [Lysobacterales bacterium]|nr:MAG: hypothetical protein EHM68_16750 [Xanthomonadales bacterium]
MPATFAQRSDCHRDTIADESVGAAAYLFDPGRSAAFWSCWIREEFQPRERNRVAYMLVRHQAGLGSFREWREASPRTRSVTMPESDLDTMDGLVEI